MEKIGIAGKKKDVLRTFKILEERYGGNTLLIEVIKDLDKKNG